MAEAIGLASGLITLVTFSIKSTSSLYRTIKDFNSHHRNVRELKEELNELCLVLASLQQTMLDSKADFAALKSPLLRCGNACKEFEMVLIKATEHSHGPKTSFRDWAKLRYMGDDIVGFKNALASYKSTITIALCDVNLRSSTVTANVLSEYQELIKNTMSDLEDRLQNVDAQLQALVPSAITRSQDEAEQKTIRNERESIQQCLDICIMVSSHIDEVQSTTFRDTVTPANEHHNHIASSDMAGSARRATDNALQHCKDTLTATSSQLHRLIEDACRRLNALNQPTSQDPAEQRKMEEEIDGIKQSLAICADASRKATADRINMYDRVTLGEDSHQIVVSTVGDLINARDISAGARSAQWLGQMSDLSLQHLSQNRSRVVSKTTDQEADDAPKFEDRYGQGRNLQS